MGEVQRIVAVEVVNHPVICRQIQVLHRVRAVVPVAAHQDQAVRRNRPDPADAFCRDPVPLIDHGSVRHLVQQLKGDILRIIEAGCQAFPQPVEPFLVFRASEKAAFFVADIEGVVQHHLQAALQAPFHRPGDSAEAFLAQLALRRFQHIIVHGKPHMIQSPAGNHIYILFLNKVIQPFFGIITLGEPSAQVHASVKSVILHFHSLHFLSFVSVYTNNPLRKRGCL